MTFDTHGNLSPYEISTINWDTIENVFVNPKRNYSANYRLTMNLEEERSEKRILRLLELISLAQTAVQRHQNAPEPSLLTLNEFEDLLERYKAELANLLAGYGLRYVLEVRQAA